MNERFTDADADGKWAAEGIRWGLFRLPEAEIGLLGDVRGLDIVELGCGTAFFSAGLARAGAHPVGVDLSRAQLDTARRCQQRHNVFFPLVEADAGQVPLRSGRFDLVVSEYGAAPWCDPAVWLAEAARLDPADRPLREQLARAYLAGGNRVSAAAYVTEVRTFPAPDGTPVPATIVRRRDTPLDVMRGGRIDRVLATLDYLARGA